MFLTSLKKKAALNRWASAVGDLLTRTPGRVSSKAIAWLLSHLRMPLFKNGYALVLSSASTAGLGTLFWVIATHHYSVETIGASSAVIAAMMFLSGATQRGLNSALVRFIPLAGRVSTRLVSIIYLISIIAAGLATLLLGQLLNPLFPILGTVEGELVPLLTFAAVVMIWSIFSLQDSVLTGLGQTHWVPIENTIVSVVKIILLIWLAQSLPGAGVLAAWLLPVVVSLVPVNLLIFRRLLPKHEQATHYQAESMTLRPIVKYVAGNHLAALFLLAYTTLLPVIVASQAGVRANAYFYLPWMIASSLQLVALNMTTSLTVEATRDRPQLRGYGYRMFVHLMQILIPVVAVIFVGAPWILRIFGDAYAVEGTALLRWLVLAILPNTIIVLYIALARVQNRVAGIIAVQGVSCAFVLGLSYRLLDFNGVTGVGIAWLASQTIVAVGLLPVLVRDWRRRAE